MKLSIFYQHILRAAEESGEPVVSVLPPGKREAELSFTMCRSDRARCLVPKF